MLQVFTETLPGAGTPRAEDEVVGPALREAPVWRGHSWAVPEEMAGKREGDQWSMGLAVGGSGA